LRRVVDEVDKLLLLRNRLLIDLACQWVHRSGWIVRWLLINANPQRVVAPTCKPMSRVLLPVFASVGSGHQSSISTGSRARKIDSGKVRRLPASNARICRTTRRYSRDRWFI